MTGQVVAGFVVPGYPHPLLVPESNPGYQRLRGAFDAVAAEIAALKPDLLLLYSTQWLSVIGHQVQADPEPTWTHVDQEWHELGSIPYKFRVDSAFGEDYVAAGRSRGLEMRTVAYEGFPVDTGSIVALKLLNPDNAIPASIVSCNMYADRAETVVLGKAALDAIRDSGKRVVAVAVTALSNRVHSSVIPFADDRIHSQKDDEWNRKYLEILEEGRLEDAAQLARTFHAQASGDQKMKAIWWLNTLMGQTNALAGNLHGYEAVYGTGAAVVGLTPAPVDAGDLEFDEADPEVHLGDRNVLGGANVFESAEGPDIALEGSHVMGAGDAGSPSTSATDVGTSGSPEPIASTPVPGSRDAKASGVVVARSAPKPVGAYPHARRVGDFLYLSGLGPRDPETDAVPGGPVWDEGGKRLDYDIVAQTESVVSNMKRVLAESGASIDDVIDVTCYLIDMDRDFAGFNQVYAKHFGDVGATRTTLEINRLPTPIAVEFKVIAKAPSSSP